MKTFRKITAWAMALAISSTATAVTAFADEAETTTTEAVTTTLAEVVTTTTAPTETTPVISPIVSADFGTATVKVNTTEKEVSIKDSATGMNVELKGNTVNFDGSVIQTVDISNTQLTDEQNAVLAGLLTVASSVKVDTLNFSDNVTEVKSMVIDSAMTDNLTMVFGKNIKTIADDFLSNSTAKVTVKGYKGTAAETFATAKNFNFVALDEPAATTTEAATVTTTAETTLTTTTVDTTTTTTTASSTNTTTTTSKATTTTTSNSPKTGDAGVGAVAGILALSALTGAIAFRKKDNE